jgi:hypothetical protein
MTSMAVKCITVDVAGTNAGGGPQNIAIAGLGVTVGDVVVGVTNAATGASLSAAFEATISIINNIVQTAQNLTGVTCHIVIVHR